MRVPRQEDVRDLLAADLKLPLILDRGRSTRSGREDQRIGLFESDRRKPPTQLLSVSVQCGAVRLIGHVVCARRHDVARPALFDMLTQATVNLLEGNRYFVGSKEFANCWQRLVEEDGPRGACG